MYHHNGTLYVRRTGVECASVTHGVSSVARLTVPIWYLYTTGPEQSVVQNCSSRPGLAEPGSWTEPYWFCDQYTNDTVQSPAMQQWECSQHGKSIDPATVFQWPSCGGGCVQNDTCIACFKACGTWGQQGAWDACECPEECYPEGVIADQTLRILGDKTADSRPWFHAVGFKRPHLSYRAPKKYFDQYDVSKIPLPLHRGPSLSAPSISYCHSCVADNHADGTRTPTGDVYGAGTVLYEDPRAANGCVKSVVNRTTAFNGTYQSYVEINMDDAAVRDLRRAYYAVISLTDNRLGTVLDYLESSGLVSNTIITLIGDHGYQNGEKGEWCKSTLFELATRIPMYVSVPDSIAPRGRGGPFPLGSAVPHSLIAKSADSGWRRGVTTDAIVESVDLYVTLADLAGLPLPKGQPLSGETLRPLLASASDAEGSVPTSSRNKTWALSQVPSLRIRCTRCARVAVYSIGCFRLI
eukprot:m.106649 g.106649  ORF g.106649 m.106649 type:complete len:467 (+) comp16913_c0_seq2:849-2249(+)